MYIYIYVYTHTYTHIYIYTYIGAKKEQSKVADVLKTAIIQIMTSKEHGVEFFQAVVN